MAMVFLLALTAVSAQDNNTIVDGDNGLKAADADENTVSAAEDDKLEKSLVDNADDDIMSAGNDDKLEKTSYWDADSGRFYDDDTVVTHNVVKYYGDKTTRFQIKVYDNDYNPEGGVDVEFGKWGYKKYTKTTNSKGLVSFPINYGVGSYSVVSYIMCEDGESYFTTHNIVKIKSTIPTKKLAKYITQKNKKFKIKFLNTKGKPLKNKVVKIRVKGKTYKKRTNSKGIAQIKINSFKLGKHKITAYNPVSKEKRKIIVKIAKRINAKSVTFKLRVDHWKYSGKRLKTGDLLLAVANSYDRQHSKGISIGTMIDAGQEFQHSTRLIQAKVWFKNEFTGKVITKIKGATRSGYNIKHMNWIEDYIPYKAKVWYTYR